MSAALSGNVNYRVLRLVQFNRGMCDIYKFQVGVITFIVLIVYLALIDMRFNSLILWMNGLFILI
jgi:hypothetical protein